MTPVREALEPQYQQFSRTAIAEMTPWVEGFDMSRVSVSAPDKEAGSPKSGDMIARNPKNHDDKWLVAAAYFADNFAAASALSGAHFTDADLDALFEASKRDAHFVGSEIRQLIGDIRTARASAAPGEPCAVKPLEWVETYHNRSDEEPIPELTGWQAETEVGFYTVNLELYIEVTLDGWQFYKIGSFDDIDAAKAAAQADYEQRIRSALVTTPQPAAGWDEAADYAERLTVALWEKHFKNDAPQWKPLSGDLIGLLTQIDNMTTSLHREAPAPAEGAKPSSIVTCCVTGAIPGDGGACGDCDPCLMGEASVPEPVKRLIAEKNSLLQRVGELEDAATARPDTAEARLREALTDAEAAFEFVRQKLVNKLDEPERTAFWKAVESREKCRAALSPPSGGDEAKESEGGVEGHAAEKRRSSTPEPEQARDEINEEGAAGIKPGPSELSPPADRREIVADLTHIVANEFLVPSDFRIGGAPIYHVGDWQRARSVIDFILAALDGAR